MGTHSPSSLAQQQHQAHQQAVAAVAAAAQVQQQLAGVPPGALNAAAAQARGPFASALRNLAKQADIKEEEDVTTRDRNDRASSGGGNVSNVAVGGPSSNATSASANSQPTSRTPLQNERIVATSSRSLTPQASSSGLSDERGSASKKRSAPSPQPVEKIARLNSQTSSSIQPELLARSGFQPYRSDERLMHPAGAFPIDAYASHFAGLPPGEFVV